MLSEIVQEVKKRTQSLWNLRFTIKDAEKRLSRETIDYHAPEVVAYRLTGDFHQRLANPSDDFSPASVSTCFGLLLPDKPLIVRERPTGLVAWAGKRLMVNSGMQRFIERFNDAIIDIMRPIHGEVPLKNWHALKEVLTVPCLGAEYGCYVTCPSCGAPFFENFDVCFGQDVRQAELGFDVSGWGHFRQQRHLIISPDVAIKLESEFGADAAYGLFPVFDMRGQAAMSVRTIIETLSPIWGQSLGDIRRYGVRAG